jgi:hypothetical protein
MHAYSFFYLHLTYGGIRGRNFEEDENIENCLFRLIFSEVTVEFVAMSSTEGIPIRRLVVNDPKDMPLHYGETPGGSIFSTTPGGKRCLFFRARSRTRLPWIV